jgi:cytidylate kinase
VTSFAADHPEVRHQMVQKQREIAQGQDLVTEGRDQGSVAFPEAQCKIFLTASAEERARRRQRDTKLRGESSDFEEIREAILQRDARDRARQVGPLIEPPDALHVVTDGLTIQEVVARVEGLVRQGQA